ncbi:hypothetical protein PINS_up000142 [Pythium insidiosum]|nr:hypothetical protein PINS_up000142 [Pythium insidiosum]
MAMNMIWRDNDKQHYEEYQKKLEYARELEKQIEERKAREREEKEQLALWDNERSPSRWWTDAASGGDSSGGLTPARMAAFSRGFQMDATALPYANPAAELGDHGPTSVASSTSYSRFRVTDQQQRVAEKAQQIEWKRMLDEQVREKRRRQQQEEEERRQRERQEAEEEVRQLREQHLRARLKFGLFPATATTDSYAPHNYVAIPSPPAPPKEQQQQQQSTDGPGGRRPSLSPGREHYRGYQSRRHSHEPAMNDGDAYRYSAMPPPAPTQLHNSGVDVEFRRTMGLVDSPTDVITSRTHIVDEYRALLSEIRREREELRRERDELRREKEELRMERASMQLENEKMATLLESQRQLHAQQQLERARELQQAATAHVQSRATAAPSFQYRTPSPRVRTSPTYRSSRRFSNAMPPQLEQRLTALAIEDSSAFDPHVVRRPSPMSMADFAALPREHRMVPNVVDSPRLHRLSRFRSRVMENPLEQSLVGESEFIAVEEDDAQREHDSDSDEQLRIQRTFSPVTTHGPRDERRVLRDSRVIKSRGFYDLNREDALPPSPIQNDDSDEEEEEEGGRNCLQPEINAE